MRVTFLGSSNGIKLTKTISKTESKSYPDVKTVSSTEYDVPVDGNWPTQFAKLIEAHGSQGHCLLKGPLKKPAVNESRAGLGDKIAYSDLLVLDVDNLSVPKGFIATPMTSADIKRLAEFILPNLGPGFTDTSYVAQASSSLGRKTDRVSMHIYIPLEMPLPPKTIKLWLKHVNQTVPLFKDQTQLSGTGQSLKYPLDPSVADNTKLIFISPPDFTDPGLDPFVTANDRIAVVNKPEISLDLAAIVSQLSPEKVFNEGVTLKEELREKAGLKKRKPMLTSVSIGGETIELLTNPDKMSISILSESPPYVRCNINGGDSGAYYFNAADPTYMYNFKDEPAFEIEKADKDFYEAIFEKYKNNPNQPGSVRPLQPVVLRDFATDTLFNGIYDPNAGKFSDTYPLTPTSAGAVEGFMRSHGQAAPSFIPDAKVVFDPPRGDQKPNLTEVPYYVNLYRPSAIQETAIAPTRALTYDTANDLVLSCPKIWTLVLHMCGDGVAEAKHFLNWLAFIYQRRTKTMTAWVFGGVPGTGKGAFINQILRPLFGEAHVTMKALENMEEQYNQFMRTAMFLVVDEFQMGASKGGYQGATRMADKLKNQITEPTLTIRGMRSNQVELPSYTNFIFLTNRPDAVRIEPGDRRYNIAPRQEKKLIDVHPHIVESFNSETDNISLELPAFAGALETFKLNAEKARVCIVNDAKETMKTVSMSIFDDYCEGFVKGKLSNIIEVLDIELTDTFNAQRISTAQNIIKLWISDAIKGVPTITKGEHLRVVYHVLNDGTQAIGPKQFSKMLTRNTLDMRSIRMPDNSIIRGIKICWTEERATLDAYVKQYFNAKDSNLLPAKTA